MWRHTVGLIVTLVFSLFVGPLTVEAQQETKVYRIGWLKTGFPPSAPHQPVDEAFRQSLRELGYVEGQNLVVESRYAEGREERLTALAAELVRLKVDVIVTTATLATRVAQHATRMIPIVMAGSADPVGLGLVASLARPGEEHHGRELPCGGAPRQAAGTPQGDRAPERPRRGISESGCSNL